MDLHQAPGSTASSSNYPSPPRVHWVVLLASWIVLAVLFQRIAPTRFQGLLNSVAVNAWIFYLCLWIRNLDPDSNSIFWCDLYALMELSYATISSLQHLTPLLDTIAGLLAVASSILGIVTLYIIRAELLKHYNEREPIGIYLGPVMTFFFSYLYFQSQLYEIAQYKRRQVKGLPPQSTNSLLS